MISFPNTKINIGLYVTSKRSDGYHDLETVFYPIPLHDVLEVNLIKNNGVPYEFVQMGKKIEGNADDNLVVRVWKSMQEEFDLPPVSIKLTKNVPTGAGLGGGSSDAAFMMKMINEIFSLGLSVSNMETRVSKFGADCAFFINNEPRMAKGIGDVFSPINIHLEGFYLCVVKPDDFVSTKEAYSNVCPKMPDNDLQESLGKDIKEWRNVIKNDFEDSVFLKHPTISAIKQTLYDMGAIYASMSGSGSSVYGLFNRNVEELERIFPDCFCYKTRILNRKY